jgi:proteasome assembly chaperone (PAC2) family protein
MVVTLGALLADVPHTRPIRLTTTAVDPELMIRLGLQRSRYEGPTGIVGALHDACSRAGMTSVSLWASVPHYVAAPPNPKATAALLEQLRALLNVPVEVDDLHAAGTVWEERVNDLVQADDEVAAYVRRLEDRADAPDIFADNDNEFPAGDAIDDELERFLRQTRDEDDD